MKYSSRPSSNPCRDAEPALADILNDSVLESLLAGDGIDRADLEAVIRRAQRRLGPSGPAETSIAECCA